MTGFDCLLFTVTGVLLVYEFIELLRGRHNLFSKMASWMREKRK